MSLTKPSAALVTAATAFLVRAQTALAAKDSESTPLNLPAPARQAEAATGGGGSLVRTIVGLAVVIGVIYGLYWVLKQVKTSRDERSSGDGLASLASLALGPNRAVHLIRAGRELVLVGVAEHGVVPIRTYTEPEARALGLLVDEAAATTEATTNGDRPAKPQRTQFPTVGEFIKSLQRKTVRK